MHRFIVQARMAHNAKLIALGVFIARDEIHAVAQAARVLCSGGENAVELVATRQN